MKRFAAVATVLLAFASSLAAGPVIDRSAERGYILSMPPVKAGSTRKVGLLIVLPGKDVKASLERNNWAFAAEHHHLALVALEVDYDKIHQENDVDALHERIQRIVREVQASQPSIEPGPAFLGGTSRGGMAALALALRHPKAYRAIGVACGAILSMGSEEDSSNARGQSFFLVHGTMDNEVPFTYFEKTIRRLAADGGLIETFVHEGAGHNLDTGDYLRIVKWMAAKRSPRAPASPAR